MHVCACVGRVDIDSAFCKHAHLVSFTKIITLIFLFFFHLIHRCKDVGIHAMPLQPAKRRIALVTNLDVPNRCHCGQAATVVGNVRHSYWRLGYYDGGSGGRANLWARWPLDEAQAEGAIDSAPRMAMA